jgi:hypothetical protein
MFIYNPIMRKAQAEFACWSVIAANERESMNRMRLHRAPRLRFGAGEDGADHFRRKENWPLARPGGLLGLAAQKLGDGVYVDHGLTNLSASASSSGVARRNVTHCPSGCL